MGHHLSGDPFDYIELLRDSEGAGVLGPLFALVCGANDLDVGHDILEVKAILPGLLFTVILMVELCSPRLWILYSPLPRECRRCACIFSVFDCDKVPTAPSCFLSVALYTLDKIKFRTLARWKNERSRKGRVFLVGGRIDQHVAFTAALTLRLLPFSQKIALPPLPGYSHMRK